MANLRVPAMVGILFFRHLQNKLYIFVANYNIICTFVVPNYIVVVNTGECPDRCSIRNWAIFMSIGIIFVKSRKW